MTTVLPFPRERLPRHVAIIMDGNGRWAKKKLWNRIRGHREGAESVDVITQYARKLGIEYLTLYAFSTENWNRPEDEVDALMDILKDFLIKKREVLLENNIRLHTIGEIHRLPKEVREIIAEVSDATERNGYKMTLTLALSYGSRQEITEAVKSICEKVEKEELTSKDVSEDTISNMLYTSQMPDPDLMIRTSGEERISNYLLWQLAYAELYFTDVYWPDFREKELMDALKSYASRERHFGKTSEQLE